MTSGSGPVAGWASEAAVVPIEPRTLPATTRRRPLRVRPVPVLRQVHHHFRLHPPAAQTTRHRARVGRPGRPAGMGPRSRTPPSHRPAHRAAARRPRSTHRSRHTGGDVTHSGHDPEQLDDPRAVHIDLVTAAHGLTAADYTFPYVTGWASEVDRRAPERVVRGTGARVLAASRTGHRALRRGPGARRRHPGPGPGARTDVERRGRGAGPTARRRGRLLRCPAGRRRPGRGPGKGDARRAGRARRRGDRLPARRGCLLYTSPSPRD